jgi:hypothetical protein
MDAPDALEIRDVRAGELIEWRVALVQERAAVRDPILFRERRELIRGKGRHAFAAARETTSGED